MSVFVEGGVIREISGRPVAGDAEIMECGGRVVMPGLIDAHVYVYAAKLDIGRLVQSPVSYLAHFAAQFLRASLDRGFTTLRDVGGADVVARRDCSGDHSLEEGQYSRCPYHGSGSAKPSGKNSSAAHIR